MLIASVLESRKNLANDPFKVDCMTIEMIMSFSIIPRIN
jgi:hypothetical protein